MKIAILKERRPHEARVAATPETVKKLKALGAEITIEAGAGTAAAYTDQAYVEAGANIVPDAATAAAAAEVIFKVQRPMSAEEGVDEMAGIERIARKKLKTLAKLDSSTQRRRLYAFLARRGYDGDDISNVIRRVLGGESEEV